MLLISLLVLAVNGSILAKLTAVYLHVQMNLLQIILYIDIWHPVVTLLVLYICLK